MTDVWTASVAVIFKIKNSSSEIRVVGEVGNSTKQNGGYTRTTKGRRIDYLPLNNISEPVITSENTSLLPSNTTTAEDGHNDNMEDKEEKSQTNPSLLLKSSANSSSALPTVGEGLDLVKPSILPKRSSPSVVPSCLGSQVTLKCAADGNPAPDFTWYKEKQSISRDKVAEFDLNVAPSLFTRASHLTFTPKKKEDFGHYECAASNTLGASQQSTYKIRLEYKGEGICAQGAYNSDRRKYNSIIIGTVSSVGMLLMMLFIAGFVFWRLNQRESDAYQSLEKSSKDNETLVNDDIQASSSDQNNQPSSESNADKDVIRDDFNAEEIGRLSMLLAGDWEKLARLLGFHQHDVNSIRGNSDKIESQCADMLNRFRKRKGSRATLAESVEEMNDVEIASAIREKYYKFNPIE